jgi:hypothetical protein
MFEVLWKELLTSITSDTLSQLLHRCVQILELMESLDHLLSFPQQDMVINSNNPMGETYMMLTGRKSIYPLTWRDDQYRFKVSIRSILSTRSETKREKYLVTCFSAFIDPVEVPIRKSKPNDTTFNIYGILRNILVLSLMVLMILLIIMSLLVSFAITIEILSNLIIESYIDTKLLCKIKCRGLQLSNSIQTSRSNHPFSERNLRHFKLRSCVKIQELHVKSDVLKVSLHDASIHESCLITCSMKDRGDMMAYIWTVTFNDLYHICEDIKISSRDCCQKVWNALLNFCFNTNSTQFTNYIFSRTLSSTFPIPIRREIVGLDIRIAKLLINVPSLAQVTKNCYYFPSHLFLFYLKYCDQINNSLKVCYRDRLNSGSLNCLVDKIQIQDSDQSYNKEFNAYDGVIVCEMKRVCLTNKPSFNSCEGLFAVVTSTRFNRKLTLSSDCINFVTVYYLKEYSQPIFKIDLIKLDQLNAVFSVLEKIPENDSDIFELLFSLDEITFSSQQRPSNERISCDKTLIDRSMVDISVTTPQNVSYSKPQLPSTIMVEMYGGIPLHTSLYPSKQKVD